MLVGKRMTQPVITVNPDTSMQDALELMRKERIRRLPVVDKHGKLVGIVSERQLLKASPSDSTTLSVFEVKTMLRKIKIKEIMTKEVITITENTPIEEAARIMSDGQFSALPVVRGNEVIGIITETALFKVFLEVLGARQAGLRVTFLVAQKPGQLAKITKVIADLGGNLISVGSFLGESSENAEITIKVEGVPEKKLIKALKPLTEKIVDVRQTDVK